VDGWEISHRPGLVLKGTLPISPPIADVVLTMPVPRAACRIIQQESSSTERSRWDRSYLEPTPFRTARIHLPLSSKLYGFHLQIKRKDLHHQSDILSISFSPFHPTLVFGGSYSGQVLLWDTRAKHLPVLKTPLSASGHTYPIYSMKMVGTQNANSLVSASTDGLVCSWLADMLAQPQVSVSH
jgi:WD40 repeat protein